MVLGGSVDGTFDSGAVALADAGNYAEVCRIQANRRPVLLRLTAGVAAVEHVKVGQSAVKDAAAIDLAVNADLNAAILVIPYAIPAFGAGGAVTPAIAAAGVHEVRIDSGAVDLVVSAKAAGTTLRVQGVILL